VWRRKRQRLSRGKNAERARDVRRQNEIRTIRTHIHSRRDTRTELHDRVRRGFYSGRCSAIHRAPRPAGLLIDVNQWKREISPFVYLGSIFTAISSPRSSSSRSRPLHPWRDEATEWARDRRNEETNGWTDSISQGPFCTTFSCFFFGYTSDELVRGRAGGRGRSKRQERWGPREGSSEVYWLIYS